MICYLLAVSSSRFTLQSNKLCFYSPLFPPLSTDWSTLNGPDLSRYCSLIGATKVCAIKTHRQVKGAFWCFHCITGSCTERFYYRCSKNGGYSSHLAASLREGIKGPKYGKKIFLCISGRIRPFRSQKNINFF